MVYAWRLDSGQLAHPRDRNALNSRDKQQHTLAENLSDRDSDKESRKRKDLEILSETTLLQFCDLQLGMRVAIFWWLQNKPSATFFATRLAIVGVIAFPSYGVDWDARRGIPLHACADPLIIGRASSKAGANRINDVDNGYLKVPSGQTALGREHALLCLRNGTLYVAMKDRDGLIFQDAVTHPRQLNPNSEYFPPATQLAAATGRKRRVSALFGRCTSAFISDEATAPGTSENESSTATHPYVKLLRQYQSQNRSTKNSPRGDLGLGMKSMHELTQKSQKSPFAKRTEFRRGESNPGFGLQQHLSIRGRPRYPSTAPDLRRRARN
ncbi:hypothetical protein B0H14DRAFT_2574072 [Mycena olivaceomarginata]|nr:hypothetical protein B0H14DRAFT_2574072 [Mycena olivaceomarginata]